MDHKWGRNITEKGFGGTYLRLAARIRTGPWHDYWLLRRVGTVSALVGFVPLDINNGYVFQNAIMPNPAAHYPFGFDVEPDGLV